MMTYKIFINCDGIDQTTQMISDSAEGSKEIRLNEEERLSGYSNSITNL